MEKKKVEDILLPYQRGVPLVPSMSPGDEITRAIEVMVHHELTCIAVVRNNRAIGMIRLKDAFRKIGIKP